MGWPMQEPFEQESSAVHGLPSSHEPFTFACAQPEDGSQVSAVHGLPSSQLAGDPVHDPSEQASPVVQALPSLHAVPSAWPLQGLDVQAFGSRMLVTAISSK